MPRRPRAAAAGRRRVSVQPATAPRYRIDDGIPVLLVDDAVAVTDDAEHQRMLDRASGEAG